MDKILIVLVILLVVAVLVLIGITIFGKKKKKEKIENVVIEEELKNEPLKEEPLKIEEPVINLEVIEPVGEIKEEPELEQTREQTEVIEIISSMQEKAKDLTEKVADYEDEQEENAIISYTELLNAVKAKKEVQEELDFDTQNKVKPVDVKSEVRYTEEKRIDEKQFERPYDDSRKFHKTEPISPLGRINREPSEESYKTKAPDVQDEDFLKSLKDFRSNL